MYQVVSKKYIKLLMVILINLFMVFKAFGATPTLIELIKDPDRWDNQVVTVQGEVIGDMMQRGDHVWLNISDGSSAIGVWIKAEETESIKVTGDYHHVGDKVEIEGIFHASYTEQGGDIAIEGKHLTVIEGGIKMLHSISVDKIIIVVTLTLVVVGCNWVRILLWMKQKLRAKSKK